MTKKNYTKPELIVHGNVEKMTLNASATNKDTRGGPNDTAFPNT